MMSNFDELSDILGVKFSDQSLLIKALTHKSFSKNSEKESYERLEYLGDSILQMVVSEYIYRHKPEYNEGEMTKLRAAVVNSKSLLECAKCWNIIKFMLRLDGEDANNVRRYKKMQSDIVEAIIAAVYLDGGYDKCREFILKYFQKKIDETSLDTLSDYKTRLQEILQKNGSEAPKYQIINISGPDHDREFESAVFFNGEELSRGVGKSKKEADQDAAKRLINNIKPKGD